MTRVERRITYSGRWVLRIWECCGLEWQLICVKGWTDQASRWTWNPVCQTCGGTWN